MKTRLTLMALSLTVILFIGFVFLPTEANAAVEGLYHYTVSNGEATITTCYASLSGTVTIPSTLGGYPVTTIGDYAFEYCVSLTSVTIPESVTYIGNYAFYNCQGLKDLTIPDNVTYIGEGAFYKCYKLTNVTIPDSVTHLGSGAFYLCYEMTSVTVSNNLTYIGDYTFYECRALTNITVPDKATYIGDYAFYNCQSLEKLTIPNGVTSIGKCAFYNCYNMASVTLPDGITSIEDGTFNKCRALTSVTIPHGVTSIGNDAFGDCTNLVSVTIPNGVTSIGNNAFGECTNLTSVTIPRGVTCIGNYTFGDCTNLASVTIPNGVTSIDTQAFYGCSSLTSITIPDSVTSIGPYAFYGCSSLTSIMIPDSVISIGSDTFSYCSNLNFNVYDNGKYLGNKENPHYVFVGVTSSNITQCQFHPNTKLIAGTAFSECTSLTSVTIPDGITSIGDSLFYKCTSLESITIPKSVTSIGQAAFYDCYKLTSITIPKGVTAIGYNTFHDCYRMTSITIPDSVTSIDDYAFDVCIGLTDVYYGGSEEQWKAISIGYANECLTNATIHFTEVSGPQEDTNAKFASTGLSLGEFIGLQSAVMKSAINGGNFDEAYFIYNQYSNNAEGVLELVATAQGEYLDMGSYFVADCKVNAKQMSDVFEITPYYVVDGVIYYGATTTTSVKAESMKKINDAKTDDKTKALCIAMLNYGAAAQANFGYGITNLANSELSAAQKVLPAFADLNLEKTNTIPTTPYKPASSGMSLGDVVYMQFLMPMSKVDADGSMKYQIIGEDPVEIKIADLETYGDTYYIINIPIKAKHVRTSIAIALFNAQGARDYGYMVCSIEAFATAKKGTSTETLVAALMAYGDAAKAVFG